MDVHNSPERYNILGENGRPDVEDIISAGVLYAEERHIWRDLLRISPVCTVEQEQKRTKRHQSIFDHFENAFLFLLSYLLGTLAQNMVSIILPLKCKRRPFK